MSDLKIEQFMFSIVMDKIFYISCEIAQGISYRYLRARLSRANSVEYFMPSMIPYLLQ